MSSIESTAASIAGLAAQLGAQRAGLGQAAVELIGNAVRDVVDAILTHHRPEALARDIAAEVAHKKAMMTAVQAAIDAGEKP